MSLEKLLASCIQETQPTGIRYIPHPNINHLYQLIYIVLKEKNPQNIPELFSSNSQTNMWNQTNDKNLNFQEKCFCPHELDSASYRKDKEQ